MRNLTIQTMVLVISSLTMSSSYAQQFIFPQKGQSAEQQQQDEYSCHTWAVGQTGFDPTKVQPQSTSSAPVASNPQGGSAMRGALGGAAAGALIAEIGGNDVSNGAAKGAAVGALANRRQNRKAAAQAAEQQALQQEQQANAEQLSQEQLANYYKARNVCLDAKGYSVSQ